MASIALDLLEQDEKSRWPADIEWDGGEGHPRDPCSPSFKINGVSACSAGCCWDGSDCVCKCTSYTSSQTCPSQRCSWNTVTSECECAADVEPTLTGYPTCAHSYMGPKGGNRTLQCNNQKRSEADVYCCNSCKTAPVRITLGGEDHRTTPLGYLQRPEYIKMNRCNATQCFECDGEVNCWSARALTSDVQINGRVFSGDPVFGAYAPIVSYIEAGSESGSSYRILAYATCDSGATGNWGLRIRELHNANIEIYLDDQLNDTKTEADVQGSRVSSSNEFVFTYAYTSTNYQHLQLVLIPVDRDQVSGAVVQLWVDNVDITVDDCMTRETCKEHLTGSELVNNNTNQLKCLQGDTSSLTSNATTTCNDWLACLGSDTRAALLALLEAFFSITNGGTSFIEIDSITEEDPLECIDPAVQDPESWECECMVSMTEACGGVVDSSCFNSLMCNHSAICQSWKGTYCSSSSSAAALIQHTHKPKPDSNLDQATQTRSLLTSGGRTRLMQGRALEGSEENADNVDLSIVRKDTGCR